MKWKELILITLVASAGALMAEEPPMHEHGQMVDCPMKDAHAAGVDTRGEKGMGFSQTKTTHHFRLSPDGGAIEVTANDAEDLTSRDQIRTHLAHIAKTFAAGNFDIPMFVHDGMPDGAKAMGQMKSRIRYSYEETKGGGRVRIASDDPGAIAAVHEFMRFQIREHRTGDPMEIATGQK